MTDQLSIITNFTPVPIGSWMVNGISGTQLTVHGYGDIRVVASVNNIEKTATIKKTLYVPGLGANLLSIAAVTDLGFSVTFVGTRVLFKCGEEVEMVCDRVGKHLYHLAITALPGIQQDTAHLALSPATPINVWHQRFGHANYRNIIKMSAQHLVDGLHLSSADTSSCTLCPGCALGKMHRSPFTSGRTRGSYTGHLIHADLCGPMQIPTPNG